MFILHLKNSFWSKHDALRRVVLVLAKVFLLFFTLLCLVFFASKIMLPKLSNRIQAKNFQSFENKIIVQKLYKINKK